MSTIRASGVFNINQRPVILPSPAGWRAVLVEGDMSNMSKWITEIKFSGLPVPEEIEWMDEKDAREYAAQQQKNPNIRWAKVRFGAIKYQSNKK